MNNLMSRVGIWLARPFFNSLQIELSQLEKKSGVLERENEKLRTSLAETISRGSYIDEAREDEKMAQAVRHWYRVVDAVEDPTLFEKMTDDERKVFLAECAIVANTRVFQRTMQYLFSSQRDETLGGAVRQDQLDYGRGVLDGITLVKEQFESFRVQYEDIHRQSEGKEPEVRM